MAIDPEKEFEDNIEIDAAEAEFEASLTPEEEFEAGLETASAQPLTPEELPTTGESTKQFVGEQLEGVMPASSTALGIYGAQKATEAAASKLKIKEGISSLLDPRKLATSGAGLKDIAAFRKLQPPEQLRIGQTLRRLEASGVMTDPDKRSDILKKESDKWGKAIKAEQVKAEDYIKMAQPGEQHKLKKDIGKSVAATMREKVKIPENIEETKSQRRQFAVDLNKWETDGMSLEELEKLRKHYQGKAYNKKTGEVLDSVAEMKYKALQEVRVPLIEKTLKYAGDDVSKLRIANRRYRDLSTAYKLAEKVRASKKAKTIGDALTDWGKKGTVLAAATALGQPHLGAVYIAVRDPELRKVVDRAMSTAKKGNTKKALDTLGSAAKTLGKGIWKFAPLVGAAATYSVARAEGLSETQAIARAAIEEIPILGMAVELGMPETTLPEAGLSREMESGKGLTPEEVKNLQSQYGFDPAKYAPGQVEVEPEVTGRRARIGLSNPLSKAKPSDVKKTYELPRNIQEMDESGISKTLQSLEATGNTSFTGPLKRALEGDEDTRRAMLFMLTQRPDFRELYRKIHKIKEEDI